MVEPLKHCQTKEAVTDMFYLKPPSALPSRSWPPFTARCSGIPRDPESSAAYLRADATRSGRYKSYQLTSFIEALSNPQQAPARSHC